MKTETKVEEIGRKEAISLIMKKQREVYESVTIDQLINLTLQLSYEGVLGVKQWADTELSSYLFEVLGMKVAVMEEDLLNVE
jgi:hypothetical protein